MSTSLCAQKGKVRSKELKSTARNTNTKLELKTIRKGMSVPAQGKNQGTRTFALDASNLPADSV